MPRSRFTVDPAHVREEPLPDEKPLAYAQRLARDKARAVFARHPRQTWYWALTPWSWSTSICWRSRPKRPSGAHVAAARRADHQVITGVCLVAAGFEATEAEVTEVRFGTVSEDEIAAYVKTGEPMDKAGAYAIQGVASRWVTRIEGCYFNVVGLPVPRVYRMLRAAEMAIGQEAVDRSNALTSRN